MPDTQPRTGHGFPKSARILRSADFRRVYEKGFRHTCPLFAAFCLLEEGGQGGPRVGFTVPKAIGKAVSRNRIRRRMREAVRMRLCRLEGPWSIVFNPRRGVLAAEFEVITREVERLFERCGAA